MSKPTVMNLSFSKAWGGLEMSSVKMTRLFHEAGHRSLEVCQPGTPIHQALQLHGLEHRTLKSRPYFSPTTTLTLRRWVKELNVRAIFLHSMKDIWLVTPAIWGLKDVKLFGFARMFITDISKKDPLHTAMYARLEKMIALSHVQRGHLQRCLPVPEEKFIVLPNGVDTETFKPRNRRDDIRAEWGFDDSHFVFGCIGRLDRQKGSMEFVEAAARIYKNHPETRFVLVGGNTVGEEEFDREVKKRIAELNLDKVIRLTDFRTDIPDVMNAIDSFVMPSYEENFANVLLEALASGLPCISTDSGGTPEILEQGRVGILCEPKSGPSLAEAMHRLVEEKGLKTELQQKAREKALRDYDIKVVFSRIQELTMN